MKEHYLHAKAHIIIINWENPNYVLYPENNPDHYQSLTGSKLDQDSSSDFFIKIQPAVFTQSCKQTDKQTNGYKNNTSLSDVIIICSNPYTFMMREVCLRYDYRKHSGRVKFKGRAKVTL